MYEKIKRNAQMELWSSTRVFFKKRVREIYSRTFILIDGGSLQGKNTLANRIAKQTNAIVLDIDLLCRDWVDERLKKVQSQDEYMKIMLSLGKLTNKFIQDELENIVCQKSKLGRPVILVGRYLELLYRAIIARTLGKYFEKTMSLLSCIVIGILYYAIILQYYPPIFIL